MTRSHVPKLRKKFCVFILIVYPVFISSASQMETLSKFLEKLEQSDKGSFNDELNKLRKALGDTGNALT